MKSDTENTKQAYAGEIIAAYSSDTCNAIVREFKLGRSIPELSGIWKIDEDIIENMIREHMR